MAGDVVIKDRIVEDDFTYLKEFGVRYKVLLDLTHKKSQKPAHLDIELDFGQTNEPDFEKFLSQFKQSPGGKTYKKLRFGEFDPKKKRLSAKYEAESFSTNVFNKARNAFQLKEALSRHDDGEVMTEMMEVDYT